MMVLFQWCVWLVIAFALAALLRRKPVETAAPAAFAIILLLYLGGLLGDLRIGLGLVWAGALAAAVWLVRLWVKPEGLAGLGGRARVARQWGVSLAAMALLAMALFFVVHAVFARLAKWSITAVSFIYVFTVMTVLGFAIEIGQRISGTGEMDFADVVAGLYGVLAFFAVYTLYRLIMLFAGWLARKIRRKRK